MEFHITLSEKMLFGLLRAALQQVPAEREVFASAAPADWENCFRLAKGQGVMALAWDGLCSLPEDNRPARPLKIRWALAVEEYERQYERYCRTVDSLTRYYASKGIAVMQMKGVGFSSYYPIPAHREGGDIDIYTFSADRNRLSDREANVLADSLMEEQGIEVNRESYKHSVFFYQGIPVENHKTFLNVKTIGSAVPVQDYLDRHTDPHPVALSEGRYEVYVPSDVFNTLFISFHAMQHYGAGLCLHHLCDWCCLTDRCGLHLPDEITDVHFREFVATLTAFCRFFLGGKTEAEYSEEALERLYLEIFRSPFAQGIASGNPLKVLAFKTRRFVHMCRLQKKVAGVPVFRRVRQSVTAHLCKPGTILKV